MNEQELRAEFERELTTEFPVTNKSEHWGYDPVFNGDEYTDPEVQAAFRMYKRAKLQSEQRIAELEAVQPSALKEKLRSAESHITELEAEIERLNAVLTRYEDNGVTCQTYRNSVDSPCAECNVAEFSKPQKEE